MRSDQTEGSSSRYHDSPTEDDTYQSLYNSSSSLGRYYRWLLDDPTTKEYWSSRTTD